MSEVEVRTIAKVTKRLVPFLIICYFVAINSIGNLAGFAGLQCGSDVPRDGRSAGPTTPCR